MKKVKEFKTLIMPISSHLKTENSVNAFVHDENYNFDPSDFEIQIMSVSKFSEDELLIGYYIIYEGV